MLAVKMNGILQKKRVFIVCKTSIPGITQNVFHMTPLLDAQRNAQRCPLIDVISHLSLLHHLEDNIVGRVGVAVAALAAATGDVTVQEEQSGGELVVADVTVAEQTAVQHKDDGEGVVQGAHQGVGDSDESKEDCNSLHVL